MTQSKFCVVLMFAWLASVARPAAAQQLPEVPTYVAMYVGQIPTIDGRLTSPDEWGSDTTIDGDWTMLHGSPDTTNNRFSIVWNDEGLFLRHEVNHTGWAERARNQMDFGYENLNLFFDPNRDGESNTAQEPTDTGVDGYQIAFNQPLGESQISSVKKTAGFYAEAHVDNLFGNQGGPFSEFKNMVVVQNTSNVDKTGYTELFIPWSNFDATDPDERQDPDAETGLFHPDIPADGESWYFNIGRNQTNGLTAAWASSPGATFLAARPHGVLQFKRPATNPFDLNADGKCDEADIDLLADAIRKGSLEGRFDVNASGQLDDADRIYYVEDVKHTYVGDSNLDGQFNTSDFVAVFQVGEYEDDEPQNSGWADGDWNGDAEFNTADFVAAFQSGGFERGPRAAVAAIPEPSATALLAALAGGAAWANIRSQKGRSSHLSRNK